jgi:hypothetical protein
MRKKIIITLFFLSFLAVGQALAQNAESVQLVNPIGGTTSNPQGTTNWVPIIGGVIRSVMAILGSVILVAFIYGGFLFVTAGGESAKIDKGKKVMMWAAIGVFIIFSSYAILRLIFTGLTGS